MKSGFVPYDVALRLKELGFDENCFGWYNKEKTFFFPANNTLHTSNFKVNNTTLIAASLWQQGEQWLREKHNLHITIETHENGWNSCLSKKVFEERVEVNSAADYGATPQARIEMTVPQSELDVPAFMRRRN